MMADSLEAVEIETGSAPRAAVIWMHGLGADGHDFVPIVPELHLPPARPVRFVFPHAPTQAVSINRGMVMRAWYDIREEQGTLVADETGIRESAKRIEALIERERGRGVPAAALVLAGFSQGGALALHTGLRHPESLAGILALSCALPLVEALAAEASPANRDVPIFFAHGTADPLIPLARARRSRDRLAELGYRVTWREYRMPHSLCAEEVRDVGAWLRAVLAERSLPPSLNNP
jgi:phospholipase/carboxylesterase